MLNIVFSCALRRAASIVHLRYRKWHVEPTEQLSSLGVTTSCFPPSACFTPLFEMPPSVPAERKLDPCFGVQLEFGELGGSGSGRSAVWAGNAFGVRQKLRVHKGLRFEVRSVMAVVVLLGVGSHLAGVLCQTENLVEDTAA